MLASSVHLHVCLFRWQSRMSPKCQKPRKTQVVKTKGGRSEKKWPLGTCKNKQFCLLISAANCPRLTFSLLCPFPLEISSIWPSAIYNFFDTFPFLT